jgi:pimeloyl-ACP methyl ester carboxylesterase
VIRVDLRGCGESEPSDGPALMEMLAGDVAGLLDALDVTSAAIVGHSIGGYVALAFFRMYAERVAGLGLVASHVNADVPQGDEGEAARKAQRELAAGREELADRLERERSMEPAIASYLPRYFASGVYREHPELVERVRAIMARQDPAGCAQLIRGMKARLGSADLLEDVHVPALVVAGGQDTYISPESLRETAAAMRDATYVLLEEAGHLPQLESPQRTADALAEFAARVRDDAPR